MNVSLHMVHGKYNTAQCYDDRIPPQFFQCRRRELLQLPENAEEGVANCVMMIFFIKRRQKKYKNGSTMPAPLLEMSEPRASCQANVFLRKQNSFHQHFPLGNSTFIDVKSVYLYTGNFQKNERAQVQTYGDDHPSDKIMIQAIVVPTGDEGCSQHVCELEYPV